MNPNNYKIGVITNSQGPSMKDLMRVANEAGVIFEPIPTTVLDLSDFTNSDFAKKLTEYDVVYYRTGLRDNLLKTVSDYLTHKNIPMINGETPYTGAHRKIQQALICTEHNITHPRSYLLPNHLYEDAKAVLGESFVMKPDVGSKGNDVVIASSQADIDAIKDRSSLSNKLIYQELIHDAAEYRVYTVGDQGIESYKKIAGDNDFRANLHAGGHMVETEPQIRDELHAFGGRVAKAFKTDLAGVDVLVKDGMFYMLEINFQPGWENLNALTGTSFSKATLQYILEKAHKHYTSE